MGNKKNPEKDDKREKADSRLKDSQDNLAGAKPGEDLSVSGDNSGVEKVEKIEVDAAEYEQLREKAKLAQDYYNKLLRLGAEFDNARKRLAKEKEEILRFSAQKIVLEILPIIDDFERLIEELTKKGVEEDLFAGIKIIQKRLQEILEKNGLKRIETVGKKFDPTKHEVLITVETDQYPEHTIIEEIRSGYYLHERVLRPAVVKVAMTKSQEGSQSDQKEKTDEKTDASG